MNIQKLIDKFYKFKVKHVLLDKRRTNSAIYEITAAFLTERIVGGEPQFREELTKMQRLIEEDGKYIRFIKNIKI